MRLSLVLFVPAALLTSCISIPGDGIVRATGEIVAPEKGETSCVLSLLDAQDQSTQLDTRVVSGKFAVNSMVPAKPKSYLVGLSCNDASLGTRLVNRPQKQATDFGRVAL